MAVVEDNADIYDKLNNIVKQGDDHNLGDTKYLQDRLHEQRILFEQLVQTIKKSDDAKAVMEKRQINLMTENKELMEMLAVQKRNYQCLRHKCKLIQNNYSKFNKMKEEYQEMSKVVKGSDTNVTETKENFTSTRSLVKMVNKCTEARSECVHCKHEKEGMAASENSVKLTKSELSRLEDDMQALKAVLQQRENTWGKLANRERLQRLQVARLNTELTNLRHVAASHQSELQQKTKALNDLNTQMERQRQECAKLQKELAKMEHHEKDYEQLYDLNMELCMQKLHKNDDHTMHSTHCRRPVKVKSHCDSNSIVQKM